MNSKQFRTWLEVDTPALRSNLHALKSKIKAGTSFMAVLKGGGWGLGLLESAKVLVEAGAQWLGVTTASDVQVLCKHLPTIPLLLLCEPPEGDLESVAVNGVRLTISNMGFARQLSHLAQLTDKIVPIHIKINTGLNRTGIKPVHAHAFVQEVSKLPGLRLEGIFTHFSCADQLSNKDITYQQLTAFKETVRNIEAQGFIIPIVHAANSAALIAFPESHLDMVRSGMSLAGLYPGPGFDKLVLLHSPFCWKTRIVQIFKLKRGDSVGYGGHYICSNDTTVATLSVGFADGLTKRFLNGGSVLIEEKSYPIIAISMDMCMVGLGAHHPESVLGKEAVLLGRQGENRLDPPIVASTIGVDVEELLCGIHPRVFRKYNSRTI